MDSADRLNEAAIAHGIDPSQHCCLQMAARIGLARAAPKDLPVLAWIATWDEYVVPVAGGSSVDSHGSPWSREVASFCPWCGSRLPASRQTDWYEQLHALGFDDPGNDAIPPDYDGDQWWRQES